MTRPPHEHRIHEHHIVVPRTARYATLGEPGPALREVWFVLHGFGQLSPYFIRHFGVLADGTRLIVAPEALNRFYLDRTSWAGAGTARVGATWMTREERESEMRDYVAWLDLLYERVFTDVAREPVRVVVLGFSQGVATGARWLCRGRARAEAFVMWAGPFPPELDAEAVRPLRAMRLKRVLGDEDEMARPEHVATEEERFRALGLEAPLVRFPGAHALHRDTLVAIARDVL
jgi:predicted esterase